MKKRILLSLVAATVFLLAACGKAASPRSGYAAQMAPAMEKLTTWQGTNARLETLFNESVTVANGAGMTRMEMIDLYNMATDYKITREDYINLGFSPLDAVARESLKVANEGKEVESLLSSVTPDQDIKSAHEAILQCIQTRSAFAQKLSSAIKNLGPVDLSEDDSVCKTFDASLKQVTDYVNGH
ncbi:MAG: hypothetical protein ACM3XO_03650 [Bacteroidota bacterium]